MSTTMRKRRLSDTTTDSDQGPRHKIRKTTHENESDDASSTEPLTTTPHPGRDITKYLLNTYRHEIDRKEKENSALEAFSLNLSSAMTKLSKKQEKLECELEQARADNQALTEEVSEIKLRLPENQSTIPAEHIRKLHRDLESLIIDFVNTYLVDQLRALPSSEHHLFAHLTRIPGLLIRDRPTRGLLFQAWIWKFLHQSIFTRYSTFWAGPWGRDATTRFDEERAAAADMDAHKRLRCDAVNHLLTLVPASKAQQIHDLAMEMFELFFVQLRTAHHDVYLGHVMADLKLILGAAAELDTMLRRSKGDHTVDLPSAGFLSREVFDAVRMKVTHYRDAGQEVVLVVSPAVYRRGTTDGEGIEEEWAAIKAKVVVGLGEEEGEDRVEVEVKEEDLQEGVEGWVNGLEEADDVESVDDLPGEESTYVDSEEGL